MISKVFIIAEAGVNHNGSLHLAKKLVDVAARAGADAVKFQSFKAEDLVIKTAAKAHYQKSSTDRRETQFAMLKKLELSEVAHRALFAYCRRKKIQFLSTPFGTANIDFLAGLGLNILKIPSGEITNLPYLRKIGRLKKKVILSTGMSSLNEIRDAVGILVKAGTPKGNITVLHCNTEYPTPFKDVNLRAMVTIQKALGVKVGYSDHTPGVEVPVAAVALGACIIEKHFTLNKRMKGPDHAASLEPDELCRMVKAVRNIEISLGCGEKMPSPSERKNINVVRKSIVAAKPISKGEIFTEANITVKRPGRGISPMKWDLVIGRPAGKNFKFDELIQI